MNQNPPRAAAVRQGGPANSGGTPSSSGARAKDADKAPGTFFLGRYRVVDEIGVGGMASVHLARMDGPGGFQKWVAIKRIHPHLVEDDQFVDMFLDEARIAAGINHANVAQVFDLGKDDNTYWIAMEYLHGEPLREVMRRQEEKRALVSPELAARICSDAAEGLHAAHELRGKNGQLLGLVHRDVTPHNLFVTYDGYTKVVDFGIAKVADRLSSTRAGTLKGKLAYMSPEQVRGAEVDRTTDIFALGVVLWELTTNQRLFRMDTDLDTLEKVQACVVPPPSTIVQDYPLELEAVVMKALAKRKQDRFTTAREFSRALQNFLMRRSAFVGPEEVATFVRQVFSDRIQKREAHLAWAADVTSTINVDQLRAQGGVPTGSDESSLDRSNADDRKRDARPGPAAGAPAPAPIPQGFPGVPVSAAGAPPPAQSAMSAASLMDDDEDVPTQVATHAMLEGVGGGEGMARSGQMPAAGGYPPPQSPPQFLATQQAPYGLRGGGTVNLAQSPYAGAPAAQQMGGAMPVDGLASTIALGQGEPPVPPGFPQQGYGQGANGAQFNQYNPGMQQGMQMPPPPNAPGQSQIETAVSLPRPNPADIWMAAQDAASARPRKNTGVLIAVVLLTALCVVGIGALLYFKFYRIQPDIEAVTPQAATATPTAVATAVAPPVVDPTPPPATPTATAVATSAPTSAPASQGGGSSQPQSQPQTSGGTTTAPKPTAEPAAEQGYLTIVCNPFCDDVLDGGRSLGPSPIVRLGVKAGQHRITLKRAGVAPKTVSLIVFPGQTTPYRAVMK